MRLTIAAALLALSAQVGTVSAPPIDVLLGKYFRFDKHQIEEVRRGRPVAVSLHGSLDREILAAGAIRIASPVDRLLDRFRKIERLERGRGFVLTKRLGDQPTLEEFAALDLPAEDLHDLRRCRPGDCKIKLNQQGFDRLAEVNWNAPDLDAVLRRFARQVVLDVITAYRTRGNAGLGLSMETHHHRDTAAEFAEMLRGKEFLQVATPGLVDYFLHYPSGPRPPGLEEFFYWSIVEFGLKKTVRLNHVVLYPLAGTPEPRWVLANRLIYATHYFQNAVEVRLVADAPTAPGKAHYLLVLNLARPDGLTGLFGGIARYKVRNGGRDTLRKTLIITKQKTESPESADAAGPGS